MILRELDLVYDVTDEKVFDALAKGGKTFYLGVDPTADSMHIGHLAALMIAKRLEMLGNKPIILVGGMTATIGDPSGKESERTLQGLETIEKNANSLKDQIRKLFGENIEIKNNIEWLNTSLIEYLRDYGKLFNINNMLAKDIVASRLDKGISYTEFSYQVLQAIDFQYLYKNFDCSIQLGGQDQWGNITSGITLIRKTCGANLEVFGITVPLLTKSDGKKFGKSEAGAVWLDSTKTSEYEFYQFLYNQSDDMVIKLVKSLTLADLDTVNRLERAVSENSREREAQTYLAEFVTEYVHGKSGLEKAKMVTQSLFSGDIATLDAETLKSAMAAVPHGEIVDKMGIQDVLVAVGAAKSKREARDFITNGAIMINGHKIIDEEWALLRSESFGGEFAVIRRGKRKYFVGKF